MTDAELGIVKHIREIAALKDDTTMTLAPGECREIVRLLDELEKYRPLIEAAERLKEVQEGHVDVSCNQWVPKEKVENSPVALMAWKRWQDEVAARAAFDGSTWDGVSERKMAGKSVNVPNAGES